MPEIVVPCPACQTALLVDELNAGHQVLCPGCSVRLVLPADLSGHLPAVAKPVDVSAEEAAAARKNHPLHRTGHMTSLPEGTPDSDPQRHAAHLPERRGLSPEEEMRRLAALTAEPAAYDLHNVDTKGRSAFPCPACHRPVWISRAEQGRAVVCEGCAQEIIAPNPSLNEPARLVHDEASAPRQRTVLPGRRQVENVPVSEQLPAGRPKRQGGQLPAARDPSPEPAAHVSERLRTRAGGMEPIPARGDVEMSPTVRKGPPAKRLATPTQEQSAAAAEFEADRAAAAAQPPQAKAIHRMSQERLPSFSPKHEADLSPEGAGKWGAAGPADNSLAFRRTLTAAVIVLLLGAIGVTAFMFRNYFAQHEAPVEKETVAESPVDGVDGARLALERFYAAQNIEDMAKEVRHPDITLPRMKAWYARIGGVPKHTVEFTVDWREQDNFERKGVNFIFTTVRLDTLKDYAVALEVPKDGSSPKIDWEYLVSWSESPWSEFLKTTSERPAEFRVSITPIDYYNGFYSDRSRYLAFRVTDPENFGSCYAYCEVNSELGKLLLKAVREARQSGLPGMTDPVTEDGIARVILRLRYLPEGKRFNQASIEALVWNSWLEP